MHILITGATGRIGSCLTRALLREGHTVRAFALPNDPNAAKIAGPNVEFVYGRLADKGALATAVVGVDAVYHLAGALTSRGNSNEEFFEFNLRGTFNLLMAVHDHAPNIQRFAYASSDAVYHPGGTSGAAFLPVDESHPRLAGSVYGASKIGAEEMCLSFWRAFGIPITILRFGATADAEELIAPRSVFARWIFLRAAINFLESTPGLSSIQKDTLAILQALDNGTEQLVVMADRDGNPEIRQWGDARDVAEGCLRVLGIQAATGEAFNLGGVAPFSSAELVNYLGMKLNLPYVMASLPTTQTAWYISSAKARGCLVMPRATQSLI